ncbi:MAG: hypothetical protein RBR08_15000 [Desulforegulaceae bacterium]|nr:hypothetical protein [Desulforegulaceae bacterium]
MEKDENKSGYYTITFNHIPENKRFDLNQKAIKGDICTHCGKWKADNPTILMRQISIIYKEYYEEGKTESLEKLLSAKQFSGEYAEILNHPSIREILLKIVRKEPKKSGAKNKNSYLYEFVAVKIAFYEVFHNLPVYYDEVRPEKDTVSKRIAEDLQNNKSLKYNLDFKTISKYIQHIKKNPKYKPFLKKYHESKSFFEAVKSGGVSDEEYLFYKKNSFVGLHFGIR